MVRCQWEEKCGVVSVLLVRCCLRICVIEECWRQPVETQNLASPEKVSAKRTDGYLLMRVAFFACETQDFASLLWGGNGIIWRR